VLSAVTDRSLPLLGGALWRDFVNTIDPRLKLPREDFLASVEQLTRWGRDVGVLSTSEERAPLAAGVGEPSFQRGRDDHPARALTRVRGPGRITVLAAASAARSSASQSTAAACSVSESRSPFRYHLRVPSAPSSTGLVLAVELVGHLRCRRIDSVSRRFRLEAPRLMLAVALAAVVLAPTAVAKDFKPGDLRVCVALRCLPITNQRALDAVGAFYYGDAKPARVLSPRPGARYVELRFRNGYVTGVAAGVRLDHFLSFGVTLDQFAARTWYLMPAPAAAEIRRLAANLRPRPLRADLLSRSH
jgi:hypothetical protein